jgi:putative endonuclease
MSKHGWFVYILLCKDKTFYTGITTDLKRRFYEHQNGVYNNYTKSRRPIKLVYYEKAEDKYKAAKREKELKDYRQEKKLLLIRNFLSNTSWF